LSMEAGMGVRNQSLTLSVSTVRNLLLGSKDLTFTEMLGVFNPLIYEGLNTPTTKPTGRSEMTIENHIDWDRVDSQGFLDEDTFWDAVSDMTGKDYDEIADGDPLEWL